SRATAWTSRRWRGWPSPDGPCAVSDDRQAAADDPERLIARAIESVLDAVPRLPGGDVAAPETSPKAQPWAETAAPAGRDKRPLEALLEEYAARVASAPNARAGRPD